MESGSFLFLLLFQFFLDVRQVFESSFLDSKASGATVAFFTPLTFYLSLMGVVCLNHFTMWTYHSPLDNLCHELYV